MSKYDLWQLLCEDDDGRGGGLLGNVGGATAQFAAVHFLNAFFSGTYKFEEVSTAATSSQGDDCVLQVTSADGTALGNIFIELKDGGGEFYQQSNNNQAALDTKLGYSGTGRGKTKGSGGEHYVMVFPGGKNYQKCYLFQGGRSGSPLPPTTAVWGKNIPEMPHIVLGGVTQKGSRPISVSKIRAKAATLEAPAGAISNVSIMKDAIVRLNSDGWRQRNRNQLADLIGVSAIEIKRVQEHMDAHGNSALPSMWHRTEARWYPYIAKLYDDPKKLTGERTNVVDAYQSDLWPRALANANSDAYTLHSIGVTDIITDTEEKEAKAEGESQVQELEGAALIDGADKLIDQADGSDASIDDLMDAATAKMEAIRAKLKNMTDRGDAATSYLGAGRNVSWMSYGDVFRDANKKERNHPEATVAKRYLRYLFGLPDDYDFESRDTKKLAKMASYGSGSKSIGEICEWWIVDVCKADTSELNRLSQQRRKAWFKKDKNRKSLSEIEAALPSLRVLIKKSRFIFSASMNEGKYSLKSRLLD